MATVISQSISDTDMLILKNDLWDINNQNNPMDNWVAGALSGKIDNCYKRLKDEWVPKLMDDASISAISASKNDFVHQVVSHSAYQNRYTQESGSSE